MVNIFAVGIGGFLGAVTRYLVAVFCRKRWETVLPIATLLVNVAGGLLIGFIMEATRSSTKISDGMKLFLTTGFLGGLTTFSTFSYETVDLLQKGNYFAGGLNIVLNLFLSIAGEYLGIFAAKLIKQIS